MEVILQTKVLKLGNIGDRVKVKRGYASNYLLPQGMAVSATAANIAQVESRRAILEEKEKEAVQHAQQRATQLQTLEIIIAAQASDEGKLYGSIGPTEIAHAITEKGVVVQRREVTVIEGVLRNIGEYMINLRLHTEVITPLKIQIIAKK